MKKIDYYAPHQPWRMPKWLGATLGSIFAVIAIGSAVAIVQLTHSPTPPLAAVVAAPPPTPAAAPVAAPAPAAAPAAAAAAVASKETPAARPHATRQRTRPHRAKVAASRHTEEGAAKRAAVVARHDSKEKRHEKDALDKLLGL